MTYRLRLAPAAQDDLARLFSFLAAEDLDAAIRAREAIAKAYEFVRAFPFACRKVDPRNAFLREIVISFGHAGYVALFEIDDDSTLTILAVRHQREDDYH